MPPMHERKMVEVHIYEFGKLKIRDNAQRFRYNTMLSKYNQFREMWGRKMREREEGPLDFRRRKAALEEKPAPPPPPPIATETSTSRVTSARPGSYVKLVPGSNGEEMQ